MKRDYDALADIYDLWSEADPSAGPSLAFYCDLMCTSEGARVELGVGTGRIAIPVLQRGGGDLTGVDESPRMLAVCLDKANRAGVAGALCLVQQDVRELELEAPADLITFPFRSIGHLLGDEDKRACFRSVYANLAPGGRFVFDHYILNEAWARSIDGVPRLMIDREVGEYRVRIHDIYHYHHAARRMHCSVRLQRFATGSEELLSEREVQFEFSWIDPDHVRRWAGETGFEVEALYGSFKVGHVFGHRATDQVWTLRRPAST